jgi:hypothetical protein
MIEIKCTELVADELEQFHRDAERDKSRLKLMLAFKPDDIPLDVELGGFTIAMPKPKFRPKVERPRGHKKSNRPNMF